MNDREIAYEQNATGLEIAWHDRIEMFAGSAIATLKPSYDGGAAGIDTDGLLFAATEAVAARLLNSEQWANVNATDISDIAYEAVGRVLKQRIRAAS